MPDSSVLNDLTEEVAAAALVDSSTATLRNARRAFERRYILMVLELNGWRVGATARALGLQRPNLYRKARQLSINLRRAETVAPAGAA